MNNIDLEKLKNEGIEWNKPICRPKLNSFEAGAASRQAEVDELQKCIDDALNVFKSDLSEIGKFNAIHKILKGEQNEP